MKRILYTVFGTVLLIANFVSAEKVAINCSPATVANNAPIPVFVVTTTPEGFTPVKNVADSTKDLIKSLNGKKGLCLTDQRDRALVVLEVLGREKSQMTATWAGTGRDVTVAVKLTAGTYETTISESAAGGTLMSGGAWGKAAGKVAKRVDEWVRQNREQLTSSPQKENISKFKEG